MATNVHNSEKGTENWTKLHKLFKLGNEICKRLLFDCIQQTGCQDLRTFLSKHESDLKLKLNRNREQIALLFPGAPLEPNIKDWDISLVAVVLRKCCNLPSTEYQALNAFTKMRNKIAHLAEPNLDEQEFLTYQKEFKRTVKVLLNHIKDPQFRDEISKSAKTITLGTPATVTLGTYLQ
ncbi:hypothetical protein DPMN_098405 [Dreissena polymorpha]|uniref:DZIP3-like HEPN domain-containing protein n=1 Tax=Dreissena polymorpha TaxID=45954 RepID=A0A9D4LCZ3_DREPO|nr:hypothetical protein DPMN_098405 [Dreissena polymorpha]